MDNYLTLASGSLFTYGRKDNIVTLKDMAWALSKICRFAGHTDKFFSVAQHSLLVEQILYREPPHIRKRGLLHDGHEGMLNDIPTPFHRHMTWKIAQHYYEATGVWHEYDVLKDLKMEIDENIFTQFNLPPTYSSYERLVIKEADHLAFITEASQLLVPRPAWLDEWRTVPFPINLVAMDHDTAARAYVKRFNEVEAEIECDRYADHKAAV
jgi:5'-deoxynucleotidase YfbR-like HD superfamily hydrolase